MIDIFNKIINGEKITAYEEAVLRLRLSVNQEEAFQDYLMEKFGNDLSGLSYRELIEAAGGLFDWHKTLGAIEKNLPFKL